MSKLKTFEVKLQLDGGRTIITAATAESDYRARQVIKLQYGGRVKSVHYVREIK